MTSSLQALVQLVDAFILFPVYVWLICSLLVTCCFSFPSSSLYLLQALVLQQRGNLMELVDPKLGSEFNKEEAVRMIKVALLCTNTSPALRPNMSAVVSMLKGQTAVHELGMDPSIYGDVLSIRALKEQSAQILQQPVSSNEAESLIQSSDATWAGSSSISTQDLYSTNLDYQ